MPASPEAYSIGTKDRGWLNEVFEGRDVPTDTFARVTVGAKVPSDHPMMPDTVVPFLDFYLENPVGAKKARYYIVSDGNLYFKSLSPDELTESNILAFSYYDNAFVVGGHMGSLVAEGVDLGSPWTGNLTRFRDIGMYGYLMLGDLTSRGITLPTPSSTVRLMGIGATGGAGVKDNYKICRKRTAGDYKWLDIFDKFQSIAILKDASGITKTDIGTVAVEILSAGNRSKVDLTYFDQCRIVFGGINNEAVVFYCKIQYSTNQTTWYDLTPEVVSDGTINEQLVVGSWGNIPTGALADVFIRAVGRAANATADPTYKNVELQVK